MVNSQEQVGYVLKQAQALLRLRMEEALKPLELTVTQYSCLHHLRRQPGISAAALARGIFVTRQSMGVLLQQLLERNLVERPAEAHSGRALPTALTAAGSRTLDAAQDAVDQVEQRMLAPLTERDRRVLRQGLEKCIEGLGG